MAILKIARMGHPILRRVADTVPVKDIQKPQIQTLIDDMLDTVRDEQGAGLAAPQVHNSTRIVVLLLDDESDFDVWINPEITALTDTTAVTFEGCLSVPGLRGAVARPDKIRVRGFYRNGTAFDRILDGFSAIVAQHECDHLNGVLYIDRADPASLAFLDEHHRFSHLLYEEDISLIEEEPSGTIDLQSQEQ